MRAIFCLIFFFQTIFCVVFGQSPIDAIKNEITLDPAFANASIGLHVVNTNTKEVVLSHNAQLALPTASTAKLFATATAFEVLGKDYQPKTRIYYDGKLLENGTLEGDLWIRGAGDVSLGSRYYNEAGKENSFLIQWADTLKKMGISSIKGNIIADASEFGYNGAPDGWSWNDMGNYYGAGPSGLPIYDNMLRYYFKVNGNGTTPELTKTFPVLANFTFSNYIKAAPSKGDNSYIYGAPYSNDRFGTGYLQMNTSIMVKGSLPDPEKTFADELYAQLLAKGISIKGKAIAARDLPLLAGWKRYKDFQLFASFSGRNVNSIAYWTNMKSVNLFAEQLVNWVGYATNGDGSTENGIQQLMKFWKEKINTSGLYLKDGSGLSRSNAISPSHLTELLVYMNESKSKEAFKATLPVTGISGTLSDVSKGQAAQGKIAAKSGTMQRIKSYAGYVQTNKKEEYAFAIVFNNYNSSTNYLMTKIEKFMNAMVTQL